MTIAKIWNSIRNEMRNAADLFIALSVGPTALEVVSPRNRSEARQHARRGRLHRA